jgi:hypothetical protein
MLLSNKPEKSIISTDKNNLRIGTLLQLAGFETPRFVIAGKLDIDAGFPLYSMRYLILNMDTLELGVKHAYDLEWICNKKNTKIQTYILEDSLPEDEIKRLYKKTLAYNDEKKLIQKHTSEYLKQKLNFGLVLFKQAKPDNAKTIIIASREIDDCIIMTENLNIKEEPFFIIGWSERRQVLFPELRKVAVLSGMPELAHFSEHNRDDEQRSIGGNRFLKRGGRYTTAWKVSKQSIDDSVEAICLAFADGRIRLNAAN